MISTDSLIQQVVAQLQQWNGASSLYSFAAVLVTYLFLLCGPGDAA